MKIKSVLSTNGLHVYIILSTLTLFGENIAIPSTFIREDCYSLFENSEYTTKLYSNLPIGPSVLKVKIDSGVVPKDTSIDPTYQSVEHTLVRSNFGPCSVNLIQLSSIGIDYSSWNIEIIVFNGLTNDTFGDIRYFMHANFDLTINQLIDTRNEFGLKVSFGNDGQDLILKPVATSSEDLNDYLRIIREDNSHLCLKTPHSGFIIIRPNYQSGYTPTCGITRIRADYNKNKETVESVYMTAYGCSSSARLTSDVIFMRYLPEANIKLTAQCIEIPADPSQPDSAAPLTDFEFTLPEETKFEQISELSLVADSRRNVFLVDEETDEDECPGGVMKFIDKTKSGIRFYANIWLKEEVSTGAEREKLIPLNDFTSCTE